MAIKSVKTSLAQTKAFSLHKLEDEILFFDYKDEILIDVDDINEAFNLYVEHSPELSNKVILAFGKHATMTSDARVYAQNKQMPTPAQAIVVRNLAQRMLARFYTLFRKDEHPIRIFSNVEAALIWLDQF
jgi:hypothetical protein